MTMQGLDNCILVAVGGAVGAVSRYLMGFLPFKNGFCFPVNTLIVNLLGTFCIGLIAGYLHKHGSLDSRWILLLQTGFCGGFTTLSSVTLDVVNMHSSEQFFAATMYYVGTMVLCLGTTWLGLWAVAHN